MDHYMCSKLPGPSGVAPWANCTTSPSVDGINCTNPMDYTNWAYTYVMPGPGQVSSSMPLLNNGDPFQGFVGLRCESSPATPSFQSPLQTQPISYIQYANDPGSNNCGQGVSECPAVSYGCPFSPVSSGTYGTCGWSSFGSGHRYFVRDWDTEMSWPNPGPNPRMMTCCSLDAGTPNRTQMCPPDVWAGSSKCQDPMVDGCSALPNLYANNSSLAPSVSNWCTSYLNQLSSSSYSTNNQVAQNVILQMLAAWKEQLNGTKPQENDPMTAFFTTWCSKYPGLCDTELEEVCSPLERADLAVADQNLYLPKLCACFMSPDTYFLPGIIPKECDALCANNLTNGVPLTQYQYDPSTGKGKVQPAICKQSSCVIDGATVSLVNSNTGGITIGSACTACGGGICNCIMTNINENLIGSSVGGQLSDGQTCGTCVLNNKVVPCSSFASSSTEKFTPVRLNASAEKKDIQIGRWLVFGFLVVLFLILLSR